MAIYHFSMKVMQRSKGRSATAAAAYRAGIDIRDERTGELHRYENRGGVFTHDILTPTRAPDWAKDAATLWNAVEERENRVDAQLARENVLALPEELSLEQNRSLLHGFVQETYVRRGMAAQVNIHAPAEDGDERNIHAHVLMTMRGINRNGWQDKKARVWNEKETLREWRTLWADHVNRALERAGFEERVTEKSFEDLGLDKIPTKHLGVAATEIERRGEQSRIAEENAVVAFQNRKMEALKTQKQILQQAIANEATRIAEERARAAEVKREKREKAEREAWRRKAPNIAGAAYLAQAENMREAKQRELLDRGPEYWAQVDKEFAQEEQEIRGAYDIEDLHEQLTEARARAAGYDNVNGLFSGAYDEAVEEIRALEKNLEDAQARQREALARLEGEREAIRAAREEREAVMNAKLNAQFEAQRGGAEIEHPDAAIEQDNAGFVVEEGHEEEQGREQEDDMDLSR